MARPPQSFVTRLHRFLIPALLGSALVAAAPAALAETVEGLAARLEEAARQVEAARDGGTPLGDPGALFPETEEVAWGNGTMRVDHASLRAEWQAVPAEGEPRRTALERLGHRLAAVRAELAASGPGADAPGHTLGDWREKLAGVMSGPEFKKQPAQEPLLAQLLRWLRDKLGFLFPSGTRQTVGNLTRWIVHALAGAAVLVILAVVLRAAIPLFRRDFRATQGDPASAPRQPETPEALLAMAEGRARAGDLRGAVQAIFRWMLLALHQSGRLDYDPALTNREHLARLKADASVRVAFEELSRQFELAWYALRPVTREGYAAFQAGCRQIAGGRA